MKEEKWEAFNETNRDLERMEWHEKTSKERTKVSKFPGDVKREGRGNKRQNTRHRKKAKRVQDRHENKGDWKRALFFFPSEKRAFRSDFGLCTSWLLFELFLQFSWYSWVTTFFSLHKRKLSYQFMYLAENISESSTWGFWKTLLLIQSESDKRQ